MFQMVSHLQRLHNSFWFIAYARRYKSILRTCRCSSLGERRYLGTKEEQQLPVRAEGWREKLGHGCCSGNTFPSVSLTWFLVADLALEISPSDSLFKALATGKVWLGTRPLATCGSYYTNQGNPWGYRTKKSKSWKKNVKAYNEIHEQTERIIINPRVATYFFEMHCFSYIDLESIFLIISCSLKPVLLSTKFLWASLADGTILCDTPKDMESGRS